MGSWSDLEACLRIGDAWSVIPFPCRSLLADHATDISRLWKNADVDLRLKLEQRAAHLLQFFTFSPSTPSAIVGQEMQRAFFTTSTKGFHMLSSKGVFPSSSVRISNPQLAKFYQGAVIPSSITVGESRMIAALTERNLVNEVSLEDAINDLMLHTLSSDETIACFQWWIGLANNRSYNRGLLNRLRNAAIIAIEEDGFAPLSSFQSYVNPKLIPLDLPLPSHTLPFVITKSFPSNQLETIFELDQLSLASFTESLVSTQKIGAGTTATVELLEKVCCALSFPKRALADSTFSRHSLRSLADGALCRFKTKTRSSRCCAFPAFRRHEGFNSRASPTSKM